MLLVVCPNLAIDRILEVETLQTFKVQRCRNVHVQPGGKGSNVSRVFRQLGGDVVVTGFVSRENGGQIVEPLRAHGVRVDAVAAYSGNNRTCTIICERESRAHPTVINEESAVIDDSAATQLMATVQKWLPSVHAVIVTGSLSRGLPATFYRDVLQLAKYGGKFTAVDATGAPLQQAVAIRPDFIKPNLDELASVIDLPAFRFVDVLGCMRDASVFPFPLPDHFAVTFGEQGALLRRDGRILHARPPSIQNTNPIGAGDAFAAGYLKAHLDGLDVESALRLATAAAVSDAATVLPGFVDAADVQRWYDHCDNRASEL